VPPETPLPMMLQRVAISGNAFYQSINNNLSAQRAICHQILKYLLRLEEILPVNNKSQARILIARMHQQFAETLFNRYQSLSSSNQGKEKETILAETMQHTRHAGEIFTTHFSETNNVKLQIEIIQNLQLLAILYSLNRDFESARVVWAQIIVLTEGRTKTRCGNVGSEESPAHLCDIYYNAGTTDYHGQHYKDAKLKLERFLACITANDGLGDREYNTALTFLRRIEEFEAVNLNVEDNSLPLSDEHESAAISSPSSDKESNTATLQQWLEHNGVIFRKVGIKVRI
jgi:hypothetical protein